MTDWLPELADDDFATLLEALEAWETKDAAGEMFGDVMDSLFVSNLPRAADQIREIRRDEKQKAVRERAMRKERSVLLRAKLLTLRDRRRVERAIATTGQS